MKNEFIVQNAIICNSCGDTITSVSRHDYNYCSCGKVSVDGGQSYLKRSAMKRSDYTEHSIVMEEASVMLAKDAVEWGQETGRNSLGIALAVIRSLRDSGNLKI